MKSRLGKKWLAVGVIWVVVLTISGWNTHLVGRVKSLRQELATLEMDLNFLQANQSEINAVHLDQSRLVHSVKSFGLGFLVVENDLKRLSWTFGLDQMRVEAENDSQDPRSAAIKIYTSGPVPAIVGWIAAVEDAYPYLVVERMDISYDYRNRTSQLQATFNYHFALTEADRRG
jgi:hypothetical protein